MDVYFDETAEQTVIGLILSGAKECTDRIPELVSDDFADPECRAFYAGIASLHSQKQTIDLPACVDKVYQTGALKRDLGDITAIGIGMMRMASSPVTMGSCIRRLKEFARRRMLREICRSITDSIGIEETDTLIDSARSKLRDAVQTRGTWADTNDIVLEMYNYIDDVGMKRLTPIKTGLANLDVISGGMWPGELTILAGRTGGGKSALSQFIATNAAKQGKKVLFVSREMSSLQYGIRSAAAMSGIDSSRIRKCNLATDEYTRLEDATGRISKLPIWFTFNTRTVEELRNEIQRKLDTTGADLVIVDYLQIMSTMKSFSSEYQRISYISRCMKEITLDFRIPVLALSQVSRGTGLLSLNSLRDSGCIEQDADSVWLINSPNQQDNGWLTPDLYKLWRTLDEKEKRFVLLSVAKNRMGSLSDVCLAFDPAKMNYTAIT